MCPACGKEGLWPSNSAGVAGAAVRSPSACRHCPNHPRTSIRRSLREKTVIASALIAAGMIASGVVAAKATDYRGTIDMRPSYGQKVHKIRGRVCHDLNRDTKCQRREPGISGVLVRGSGQFSYRSIDLSRTFQDATIRELTPFSSRITPSSNAIPPVRLMWERCPALLQNILGNRR
jgi:hypothetical protein